MKSHRRDFLASVLAALTLLVGCTARGGPQPAVEPDRAQPEVPIETRYGTVLLHRGECDEVDLEQIRASLEAGYEKARSQLPRVGRHRLDGLTMVGQLDPYAKSGPERIRAYGYYRRPERLIVFRCGVEIVAKHELMHHFCHELAVDCGRGGCGLIDHPKGFTLDCRSMPASK